MHAFLICSLTRARIGPAQTLAIEVGVGVGAGDALLEGRAPQAVSARGTVSTCGLRITGSGGGAVAGGEVRSCEGGGGVPEERGSDRSTATGMPGLPSWL